MPTVDLNADLGEGCGSDEELLELVSSASIACGAHAGDERTMRDTIEAALSRGVSVGAHPGYPDRDGFGRREIGASPSDIETLVSAQLTAFAAACDELGATFSHVKPHGAMYHRAATDAAAAVSIARAIGGVDRSLIVLCMPGSLLDHAADEAGLPTAAEGFLDRAYETQWALVPRSSPGASIDDPDVAAACAEHMVLGHSLTLIDGTQHAIDVESLCVHGDNPNAVALMRAARSRLEQRGVTIASFRHA